MRSRRSACALVIVAACGTSGQRTVGIDRITPAAGTPQDAIPIELDGAFALDVTNDLDTGTTGVASVDVLIDDQPLADVVWRDDAHISATIPAGMTPGNHDIVVRIGSRRGVLTDGFAITGSSIVSSLALPPTLGRGAQATVTMTVTNTGTTAATAVSPSVLTTTGTGAATLVTPPAAGASIAGGASTTFAWTYTMDAVGTIAFMGNATATDEATGLAIESPVTTSNLADITEVITVVGDPLGDGSSFGYVVAYQGQVYVGPNQTGTGVTRLAPDGTGLEQVTFTFARDTSGNATTNTSAGPYTSIGYTGCTANTSECGPDNEHGRGLLASGMLGGSEWLLIGGANTSEQLDHLYMTTDTDPVLDFLYVDLGNYLGAQTHGFSAAHFLGDRLYLGFPDTGGGKPYLLALQVTPTAPGLDASGQNVINLGGDAFPDFATTSPAMIDSFGDLNGLLYVANQAGIYAATVANPGVYSTTDWAAATPAFTKWTSKTSRPPVNESDLMPTDRAIVQFAAFGGRLFVGRNTTTGPQLWSCNPAGSSSATRCEPGDWLLVAPNVLGDTALTQFNNAALTSITMVVATAQYLYVGFDSASGVQVFRTSNPAAGLASDFEGAGGCAANTHPQTCNGLGGPGLGDPSDTRILDGKAITADGTSRVWITVGDATGALRLVVLP